jgi:hypothetical protein
MRSLSAMDQRRDSMPVLSPSGSIGALAIGLASGCLSASGGEVTSTTSSPIQGGRLDTADSFVVGIVRTPRQGQAVLCTGALLAPNLVATARRCVADMEPIPVDCAQSTFGPVAPASELVVTTDALITPSSNTIPVDTILGPAGVDHPGVCGNDIALLILKTRVALPAYVVPVIDPPMTDHRAYSTTVTAVGYGVSSPTDVTGSSAGVRRSKRDVALYCIAGDPAFVDCSDSRALKTSLATPVVAGEFVSGDGSACDGDWGSSVFEQNSFDTGAPFSFGVLTRAGVSPDGQRCTEPIYSRFDAWATLLQDGAHQAAMASGYAVPAWATGPVTASPGPSHASPDGTPCQQSAECAHSSSCVSIDGQTFVCASRCANGACVDDVRCVAGYCFPRASSNQAQPEGGSACSVAVAPISDALHAWGAAAAVLAPAMLGFVRARAKRRRS